MRFLLRSGRESETSSTDSDKLSPRFLGYFLFPSSYKKSSLDKRFMCIPLLLCVHLYPDFLFQMMLIWLVLFWISTSFKEQNANVASVKNILESHASYLMSGKELSKLVAFVKGTQFDLSVRTGS